MRSSALLIIRVQQANGCHEAGCGVRVRRSLYDEGFFSTLACFSKGVEADIGSSEHIKSSSIVLVALLTDSLFFWPTTTVHLSIAGARFASRNWGRSRSQSKDLGVQAELIYERRNALNAFAYLPLGYYFAYKGS